MFGIARLDGALAMVDRALLREIGEGTCRSNERVGFGAVVGDGHRQNHVGSDGFGRGDPCLRHGYVRAGSQAHAEEQNQQRCRSHNRRARRRPAPCAPILRTSGVDGITFLKTPFPHTTNSPLLQQLPTKSSRFLPRSAERIVALPFHSPAHEAFHTIDHSASLEVCAYVMLVENDALCPLDRTSEYSDGRFNSRAQRPRQFRNCRRRSLGIVPVTASCAWSP